MVWFLLYLIDTVFTKSNRLLLFLIEKKNVLSPQILSHSRMRKAGFHVSPLLVTSPGPWARHPVFLTLSAPLRKWT